MSISFNCPHCSKRLSVPDQSASKKGRCQECGAVIAIADVLVLQNYERIRKSVHRDNLAHRDEGDDDPAVFLTDDADVLFRLLLLANPIAVRGDICRRLVALGLGHTIVPRLKGKLVHRESHIRRAAALALLPFAHESPDDLLKPIRALLNDDDSNTRYAVGRELLLLHDDKAAVPVVQERSCPMCAA